MKTKSLIFTFLLTTLACTAFATVITVSNNPNSPGQYTNLQTAINAAGINGDTILVSGSASNYGDITIAKRLVLVGAGYNNPYGPNTYLNSIQFQRSNEYVGASGTKIMGFYMTNTITLDPYSGGGAPVMNNVLIERCWLSNVTFQNDYRSNIFTNDTIRNCIVNGTITLSFYSSSGQYNGIYIHNNLFNGACFQSYTGANLSQVYVRNNIYINRPNNAIFNSCVNMVIENNIFYGAYPTGCSGCAYTDNIGYLCPDMPPAGNIGSGNMNGTNPQFVNFPLLGAGFSWSYDFHLLPGSPGLNAGTDGTDIGVYGGMLPYEMGANPHFPQMMTLTLPSGSSVPAGGTLNVHFTAKKQN